MSGLPGKVSFAALGGAKRNYSQGVDPTTEVSSVEHNRAFSCVSGMTKTAVRAMRSFVGVNGAHPTDPDDFVHDSVWGDAPSVKPTVERASEGVWDLDWPAQVETELSDAPEEDGGGDVYTLNFTRAYAQVEIADGTFKYVSAKVTGPHSVRVYGFAGTTADDLPGLPITVWVY